MRIKLLSRYASPIGNFTVGTELDVPTEEAKQLINGKYAEALEPLPEEEGPTELEDMTVVQMKSLADDLELEYGSKIKKPELLELIENFLAENAGPDEGGDKGPGQDEE
jgi:hypothetical protein